MNLIDEVRLAWRARSVWRDAKEAAMADTTTTGASDGKSLLASKTFWANLLAGGLQIAGMVSGFMPEKYAPLGVAVQSILNIVLRLVTNQPITTGAAPAK